ncbi:MULTISPECIES: helix-turn-helix domain-containing protein [Robertmurraya]|uniref:Helix-turn-helix domain-containing protein n=1 Tax=Robertmurraya beringensis TaxID=641660 RepID=A0ABV6KSR0_9BACI
MSNLLLTVGSRIRAIRKQKGLTQEQLAELAGLQDSYIGGVERGERNISMETLEKLLVGLNISPLFLFQYHSIDIEGEGDKKDVINKLNVILENSTKDELILIYNIVKEIKEYNRKN